MATNILNVIDDLDSLTQNYKGNVKDDAMKCGYLQATENVYEVVNFMPFLCAIPFTSKQDFPCLTLSNEELARRQEILKKLGYFKVNGQRDLVHVNEELIDKVEWCKHYEYPYAEDSVLFPCVVDSPKYKDNYYMNGYLFETDKSSIPENFKEVNLVEYNKICSKLQNICYGAYRKLLKITPDAYLEVFRMCKNSGIENEDDLIIPALEILSKDNSFVDPEAIREMIPAESNDISLSMRNGQR